MKTAFTSLILFGIVTLSAIAQDTSRWGLPEGAEARLGRGIVFKIEYSPDGTRLAVASSSGIWLYDSVAAAPIALMRSGNSFGALDIAFGPDGRTLVSGSGNLHLWDVVRGEKKDFPHKGDRSASLVAFSADGRMIAAGDEHRVYIWDAVTGEQKYAWGEWDPNRYLRGWELGEVRSLAFSPDGRTLASGHKSFHVGHSEGNGEIRLWDAVTGKLKKTLVYTGLATSLDFSPDGRTLAVGHLDWSLAFGASGWVTLRDAETGNIKHVLSGHAGPVKSVVFSADGRLLASGGGIDEEYGVGGDTVRLWDAATGAHLRTLKEYVWEVRSLALSPDGRTLAIASPGGRLSLWDSAKGTRKRRVEGHTSSVYSVAFSPDGRTVASGSWDSRIHLWDAVTGSHKYTLEGHTNSISSVAFSPDGSILVSGTSVNEYDSSRGGTVRLWDTVTGAYKYTLEGQRNTVSSVAFSPDGSTLATGGGVLRLYDVATGVRIRTLDGQNGYIIDVAFSPDGSTLAGVTDNEIRLWHAEIGTLKRILTAKSENPSLDGVAFSPDGRTVAAGDWGTIHLWDAATGKHRRTLDGLQGGDTFVAFSPDGYTIASATATWSDKTVRLWDTATGENIRAFKGHAGSVYSLAFSRDGRTLASGGGDGTVLLWEIMPSTDFLQVDNSQVSELSQVNPDVNGDGGVDVQDLVLVAGRLGITAVNRADVNGDGTVNMADLALVAGMADDVTSALPMFSNGAMMLRTTDIELWLEQVWGLGIPEPISQRAIQFLQNLLEALTPERTALLPNYPNPFNPETWIPYRLAQDTGVQISIYNSKGILVRKLDLGLQPEGFYTDKRHAAYWDGRNEGGELLASGLYVYEFRAGSFRASRRMAFVR